VTNYYYEVADPLLDAWGGKYHVVTSRSSSAIMAGGMTLAMHSQRIWLEKNGSVRFVKNRFLSETDYDNVDMQEFMWVKLSSKVING